MTNQNQITLKQINFIKKLDATITEEQIKDFSTIEASKLIRKLLKQIKSNVLNQNKGLTDFIKELEKQAKENNIYFDIICESPKLVIPYKTDNCTKSSHCISF